MHGRAAIGAAHMGAGRPAVSGSQRHPAWSGCKRGDGDVAWRICFLFGGGGRGPQCSVVLVMKQARALPHARQDDHITT